MGIHTIIGAEAFHYPVRDGKEWDHLAMAAKLDLLFCLTPYKADSNKTNLKEVVVLLIGLDCFFARIIRITCLRL